MSDNFGRQKEESIYKHTANVRLMAAAPSMYDALWAIANMQVQEETDKGEVLALCKSIALLGLEKCSTCMSVRAQE